MPIIAADPSVRPGSRYFHPTDPDLTPLDFTKSIYLNLLAHFSVEEVVASCAYDAPAYLQTIRHKIKAERDLGVLGHIVDETLPGMPGFRMGRR